MIAEGRACWVIYRDGRPCERVHYGLGLCGLHYTRHKAGWTDEGLSLPLGASRTSGLCPVVWHGTGSRCGAPTSRADLCRLHLERRRRGWADEDLGRPKRVRDASGSTCSVLEHDTGSRCGRSVASKGMCQRHYERHLRGWSDDELGLPKGATRTVRGTCSIVEHHTGVVCPDLVESTGMCRRHYDRQLRGWSDDELGLPKGAARAVRGACSIVEHDTGLECPDEVKARGMCTFHYQRAHKGWPADRLGAPRARRGRVAQRVDLVALRLDRELFCADNTTGVNYIRALRPWRRWLERLAVEDPAALAQPEEFLVTSFIADRCADGGSASKADVPAAAISWWACHDGRPDPTLATKDMRKAHRRRNPVPPPVAGELTVDGVRALLKALAGTRWAHHRDDPDAADRLARAVVLTIFHLAARYSDLARLRTDDVCRTEEGWRVVPWVRKNWPGGTPDGLWLVPTRDSLFDPVTAMDAWMEFRAPLGDGALFCHFDGTWHPDKSFDYDQLDTFLRRLGVAAGLGPMSSGVFRRTMTQLLTAQGATDTALIRLLGQRDTKSLRRYQSKKAAPSAGEQIVGLYRQLETAEVEEDDDEC